MSVGVARSGCGLRRQPQPIPFDKTDRVSSSEAALGGSAASAAAQLKADRDLRLDVGKARLLPTSGAKAFDATRVIASG